MKPDRVVVFGVSAVGKSTVGAHLAKVLGVPFIDADDLHPSTSIAKMARGEPLHDADRMPWLHACGRALASAPQGGVLACSALARSYRRVLVDEAPGATFVHLAAEFDLIRLRAEQRTGHFMPPALLESQFATLEPLEPEENGLVADADNELPVILAEILDGLREARGE